MPANPNYNTLLSTTLKKYRKTLEDNVFNRLPLFWWLRQAGRSEGLSGGTSIVTPLLYEENNTFGWYGPYDEFDVSPQEGISAAEYQWKQAYVSITISGPEERMNSGPEQLINLLTAKIQQAEQTFRTKLSEALCKPVSQKPSGAILGLPDIISTSGTLGGIDSSVYTWWRATILDSKFSNNQVTGPANIISALRNMYYKLQKYPGASVDLILMHRIAMEDYESQLQSAHLRIINKKAADAGFDNIMFKSATMMVEPLLEVDSTSYGYVFFINSNFMKLVYHNKANMVQTPWVRPGNQDARMCQILWMGNLTCSNRRALGYFQYKNS